MILLIIPLFWIGTILLGADSTPVAITGAVLMIAPSLINIVLSERRKQRERMGNYG